MVVRSVLLFPNMRKFVIILICVLISWNFLSCGKSETQKQDTEPARNEQNDSEEDNDTSMTPEESFSSALVQDILGDDNDSDLESYLEEQIYPFASKSPKVTIDRISASVYLLTYEDGGEKKNILIQKFYNPEKDEYVFERTNTDINPLKQFSK